MKVILKEPRPAMVDSEILSSDCDHIEFGNPSSHTFGASLMGFATLYLLTKNNNIKLSNF